MSLRSVNRVSCLQLKKSFWNNLFLTGIVAGLIPFPFFLPAQNVDFVRLPPGFEIRIYAEEVPNARSMVLGDDGVLYVGSRNEGKVYALIDRDEDHVVDRVHVLADDLEMPSGVAFKNGHLYVSEVSRILRFDRIGERLSNPPEPVVVSNAFPSDRNHGWKFIDFGPDGKLYVPVGAPCNSCKGRKKIHASITRMNADGKNLEIVAEGVRNSVGFDWHPITGELWFTDNGRDHLGDNLPPDELNHAPEPGLHFGFPYCHGGFLPDPEFGDERSCADFQSPARQLGPHVASLGMKFYTGTMFPASYHNQIFIAEHGSWNRSKAIGYRITLVKLDGNKVIDYDVFADGWLQDDGHVLGRPTALLIMPDGSLLVSDDRANKIYRITYSGN